MKKNDNLNQPSISFSVSREPLSGELQQIKWFINSKQSLLSFLKLKKLNFFKKNHYFPYCHCLKLTSIPLKKKSHLFSILLQMRENKHIKKLNKHKQASQSSKQVAITDMERKMSEIGCNNRTLFSKNFTDPFLKSRLHTIFR